MRAHRVYVPSRLPNTPGHFNCSRCGKVTKRDTVYCEQCHAYFGDPAPSGILEAMKARAARENETVEEWL